MAHDVFISHSFKDKPVADAICVNLEAAGIRCWIAPRDIAPGEDWPSAITNAISQSHVMVLVFSANSNSSDDISRELYLAVNNKLVIIPFKIENIEPEPGKKYYLARTHWLDAINPPTQEQIHELLDRVKALVPNRVTSPVSEAPSTTPAHIDLPIIENGPSQPPLPQPATRTKSIWLHYLWIPPLLVLLGLVIWIFSRNIIPPNDQPTQTSVTELSTPTHALAIIPNPIIILDRIELVEVSGAGLYNVFFISVTNWNEFPAELFSVASDLPPCDLNQNASRTWVNFFNAVDDSWIWGRCDFTDPSQLKSLDFVLEKDTATPISVYLVIWDRRTGIKYTSSVLVVKK